MRFKLVIEEHFETPEMMASFATNYANFLRGLGINPEAKRELPAVAELSKTVPVEPAKPAADAPQYFSPAQTRELAAAREIPGVKSHYISQDTFTKQPESSGDETAAAELPAALSPRADETGGSLTPESDAVPPAAPRRRRGRPSKATAETTQPQTVAFHKELPANSTPEQVADAFANVKNEAAALFDAPKQDTKPEQKAEEPAAATGAVTLDMVKGLYAKALEPDDGEEQIMAVHKKHGFVRLRECPAEKYAAVYASLQELIKTQAAAALV